jgi:hypothetical protein
VLLIGTASVLCSLRLGATKWLGLTACLIACLTLAASSFDANRMTTVPGEHDTSGYGMWTSLYGGFSDVNLGGVDARWGDPNETARRRASAEWWRVSTRMSRLLDDYRHSTGACCIASVVTGNSYLVNANTIWLANELRDTSGTDVFTADSSAIQGDLRSTLLPGARTVPTVLILIGSSERALLPTDLEQEHVLRLSEKLGWRVWRSIDMPDGNRIRVLQPA